MTKVVLVAAAVAPSARFSFMAGAVQLLVLAALLVVVIGVPTIVVLLVRKQRVSDRGSV